VLFSVLDRGWKLKVYGQKSADILFDAYEYFKGKLPADICKQSRIKIKLEVSPKFGPKEASLFYWHQQRLWNILLPEVGFGIYADFLAYHELAHFFLLTNNIPAPFGSKEYWILEGWCNNFAVAMILARFDIKAVSEEDKFIYFTEKSSSSEKDFDSNIINLLDGYFAGREIHPDLHKFYELFAKKLP